eukprot:maker-scaffold_29-snap-gene-1.1-mRNA-1 protein AED:0.01 eAED:0.01 QI:259/1/1/1/1/1/2/64/298
MFGLRKNYKTILVAGASTALGFDYFNQKSSCKEEINTKPALSKKEFREFELVEKEALTHNTSLYRFKFDDPKQISGLSVASCLMVKAEVNGKSVSRPYTPVSMNDQTGHLDLLIKTYPAPGGIMSRHVDSLNLGDKLEMKGPFMKLKYEANMKKKIGMVAGGTGITPMLQIIRQVLADPEDKTKLTLIFANVTEEDIILRKELQALQVLHGEDKLEIFYTLDKPVKGWKYGEGFVSEEMLKEKLGIKAEEGEDVMVLVCGPKGFMKHVSGDKGPNRTQGEVGGLLKKLGFNEDQVYKF